MKTESTSGKQFTGRHMLAVMFVFFGVIIAVNVTMAVKANTSWTGFVVKNSYIASQQFNEKAEEGRKQAALNWESQLEITDGHIRYALADASGSPIILSGGTADFRRPTSDREDVKVVFEVDGMTLNSAVKIGDGVWIVEILADAGLDTPYRETQRVHVRDGAVR